MKTIGGQKGNEKEDQEEKKNGRSELHCFNHCFQRITSGRLNVVDLDTDISLVVKGASQDHYE